jgi:hypothetical protein
MQYFWFVFLQGLTLLGACTQILFHPVSRPCVGIGIISSSYTLHPEDGGRMLFQNIIVYVQDHNLNTHCPENLRIYNTVTDLT